MRFINVDVAIARSYQLEITDLPADADQPKLQRELSKIMLESLKETQNKIKFNSLAIQAVERPSSAEHRSKENSEMNTIKRQRTFKVNFQTRQEMLVAMNILRKSTSSQSDEHLHF